MALFLSPQQLGKASHTPSISNTPPQPYSSTPRQFTATGHDHQPVQETLFMSSSQMESSPTGLPDLNFSRDDREGLNEAASTPNQVKLDLPLASWTPLRTLRDGEGLSTSDREADELSMTGGAANSTRVTMERLGRPSPTSSQNIQATAKRTLEPSLDTKPSKAKKARFDGVVISTKPPSHHRKYGPKKKSRRGPASSAHVLSLVDALARTFNANKHTENPFSHLSLGSSSRQRDNTSTAPQTDAETTEAEDERLRLNRRLAPSRTSLKRQRRDARTDAIGAGSVHASETNSEDVSFLGHEVMQAERPAKRLKAIQYDSNAAMIDAALGTVQASIGWDAELDFFTREDDFVGPARAAQASPADVPMAVDQGVRATSHSPGKRSMRSATPAVSERRTHPVGGSKGAVLVPYLSRGAKFRQRLDAIFGENMTVRTDRVARPRPPDLDYLVLSDDYEVDRAPSPDSSETTASASSASIAEEGLSGVPSTSVTSRSSNDLPVNASVDRLPRTQPDEVDVSTGPFNDEEAQMNGWITTLQRLIKGKVHIKEEDLETISVILAEIESVKDSLVDSVSMVPELRESVRQLSKLHEIPFGDRNKLRQRSKNILHTWAFMEEP